MFYVLNYFFFCHNNVKNEWT